MKFGPTRGSFLFLFEHFLRDFGLLMLVVVVAIFKGPDILLQNMGLVLVFLITPLSTIGKYFFTLYSIDEEKMIINSGLFVKKKMEIPLKAITTVDLSQNLLYQICNVFKIKADNASQTNDNAKQAEVVMVLKKADAMFVKELLEAKGNASSEDSGSVTGIASQVDDVQIRPVISCSVSDFILMGILQSKQVYIFTMLSSIYGGAIFLGSILFDDSKMSDWMNNNLHFLQSAAGIIVLVIIVYLIGAITSSVATAIRYYGYTVRDRKDALLVDFGLLTKKHYTLSKEKICGITIRQSILMRVFGYCTAEVFIIGYGDSDGKEKELSILYPIAKLNQINSVLENILPDMSFERDYHKSEKGSMHYFFFTPRVFMLIIGVIAAIIVLIELNVDSRWDLAVAGIFALIIIATIVSVYLEYKNSGIYANNKVISISSGMLAKQMIFVKTGNVESVSEQTNLLKRKKGYTSIKLGFLGPIRVAHVKAKNVKYAEFGEVQKVLDI